MLQTQRFLFSLSAQMASFENARWVDSIPTLMQTHFIESFENYDIAHAPLRAANSAPANRQIVINVRRFQITTEGGPAAQIQLSARILDKDGKFIASRLFEEDQKSDKMELAVAVPAFNDAFIRMAKDIISGRQMLSRPSHKCAPAPALLHSLYSHNLSIVGFASKETPSLQKTNYCWLAC